MKNPFFPAWLSLGSNLGDSMQQLATAVTLIGSDVELTQVHRLSPVYRTKAWGNTEQPDFLNMAVELRTALPAAELMQSLLAVERKMGRERLEKWGPRTIDIDLLFYRDETIREPQLQVPHPLLHERRFVLLPMNDLSPELIHPVLGKSIARLLADCPDQSEALPASVLPLT